MTEIFSACTEIFSARVLGKIAYQLQQNDFFFVITMLLPWARFHLLFQQVTLCCSANYGNTNESDEVEWWGMERTLICFPNGMFALTPLNYTQGTFGEEGLDNIHQWCSASVSLESLLSEFTWYLVSIHIIKNHKISHFSFRNGKNIGVVIGSCLAILKIGTG